MNTSRFINPEKDPFLSGDSLTILLHDISKKDAEAIRRSLAPLTANLDIWPVTHLADLLHEIDRIPPHNDTAAVIIRSDTGIHVDEIIDGIRARHHTIPVVLIAADTPEYDPRKALEKGLVDCLSRESLSRLPYVLNREIRLNSLRRRLSEQQDMFDHVAHEIPGYIFQRLQSGDGRFRYTYLSPSLGREFGVDETKLIEDPANFWALIHPDDRESLKAVFSEARENISPYKVEYRAILPDSRVVWIRAHAQPRLLDNGDVMWNGIGIDVTKEKYARDKLDYLAYFDAVTGLPNRHLFFDRLEQALKQYERMKTSFALHIIDLDNFKEINDRFGHLAGDRLLKSIAAHLAGLIRESDTLSRIGGDEFALIQTAVTEDAQVGFLADKLIRRAPEAEIINGQTVSTQYSIGSCHYRPEQGQSLDKHTGTELMRRADLALYEAKKRRGSASCLYTRDMEG